jgi:hypothetical protein
MSTIVTLVLCLILGNGAPLDAYGSEAEPAVAQQAEVKFTEGIYCGICHTNSDRAKAMRDAQGRAIAPYDLWRSSAMANSARDPYWRAVVSVEISATSSRKAEIEQTCSRCHAPMAGQVPVSPDGSVLAYLQQRDEQAFLGNDGASCTVCHQITNENLGKEESFTGGFTIGTKGLAFGPHADPYDVPMKEHAGYQPVEGQHVMKSALCATCHTLISDTLDADGTESGDRFHEQTAYLEWRNSSFNNEREPEREEAKSCQACHLPVSDEDGHVIRTAISRAPGGGDYAQVEPRSPYGRHLLVGGNTLLAQILRDNSNELAVFASGSAFDATIAATRSLLQNDTAKITIGDVQWQNGKLMIPVQVRNLAGHKLPTGFPSRRVWVRVELRDQNDALLFLSGGFDATGQIIDAAAKPLDSERADGPVQPHYAVIRSSAEVQIYESVMADKQGDLTFLVLRAADYLKDNRLLPHGWTPAHPDARATAPIGVAGDDSFASGEDVVWYEVPVDADKPVIIQASLHYQSIGVRHVNEVFRYKTPEVAAFRRMYEAADRSPETLDKTTRRYDPGK